MAKKETTAKKKAKKKSKVKDNINAQPEVNIGLVGHVDHGKTTLTERLSGKWTDTHSEELKRGITIRLGYADTVFRKCPKCNEYTVDKKCEKCDEDTVAVRKVSFVDAPGHESLMATMLSGATIIDGALLLIAANEECPQPQTKEHLMALEIAEVENIIIIQNKIDLVNEEQALKNYDQIKKFLKDTRFKDAPIIPISAKFGINSDILINTIQKLIKTPKRDNKKDLVMYIARSFDINKPGTKIDKMHGGVLGGSIQQGTLKVDDEIEIRPGVGIGDKKNKVYEILKTKVVGLMTGGEKVDSLQPGGSVAVLTLLDPSIIKSDRLTGCVIGHPGKLPPVWNELNMKLNLLQRVVGTKEDLNVDPIKKNEILMHYVISITQLVHEMNRYKLEQEL